MTNKLMVDIIQGYALERLRELPEESVQCCVTSLPLRTAECPQFAAEEFQPGILDFVSQKMHACGIRWRKDKHSFRPNFRRAAISVAVVGEPEAISNAIGYAKFRSRSHDAVIRVYDDAGKLIETHEHTAEFKDW